MPRERPIPGFSLELAIQTEQNQIYWDWLTQGDLHSAAFKYSTDCQQPQMLPGARESKSTHP
jgi:hypothetical protein